MRRSPCRLTTISIAFLSLSVIANIAGFASDCVGASSAFSRDRPAGCAARDSSDTSAEDAGKRKLEWHKAWENFETAKDHKKHFLRSSLEVLGLVGISTISYYANPSVNEFDWDLEWDWQSWKQKLDFEAWVIDSNEFNTNMYHHPMAGCGFYVFSRANNLSDWESFLLSVGASVVWEYIAEFREQISINDMVSTPVGGYAIGASMYQLYRYFVQSDVNWIAKVITAPLGGPRFIHDWTDGNHPIVSQNKGRLGLLADYWHRFDMWAGVMARDVGGEQWSGPMADLGWATKIIAIEGYGKSDMPRGAMYYEGPITELGLDMAFDTQGLQRTAMYAQVATLGYFAQELRQSGEDRFGLNYFAGPATAFEYYWENLGGNDMRNKYAMVDILGPTLDMALYHGRIEVRFDLNVFFHMSAIQPLVLDRIFVGSQPIVREPDGTYEYIYTKGSLQNQGYYWAIGPTVSSHAEIEYKPVRFGVDSWYHYFSSIEGIDRFQDQIVDDFHLEDTRYGYRLTGACTIPYTDDLLMLTLNFEHHFMSSNVPGRAYLSLTEAILTGALTFEF